MIGSTRKANAPACRACFLLLLSAAMALCPAQQLPSYPEYRHSHVILDLVDSPMMTRLGVGRLQDECPVAYGRKWFPEGPYIDVVRVDTLVDNPLGKYYLYYTVHAHVGCGMAWADDLNGPWTFMDTLLWQDGAAVDVHWLEESRQFAAYYHPSNWQSDMRFSTDGLTWSERHLIAKAQDLYGDGTGFPCFFYTKVYEHTCPSLDNKYIMLWRAQSEKSYENGRWNHATCLMYSDDGTNWTFFPEIIHYDGPALGTNFLQWGERYLLMNWGYGYCEPDHRLTPGGPNLMIYETPADLARQRGRRKEDGSCENTMNLIEAEPGCGYTVDADSGKGPLEGKHIVEGDTLYHFCVAWNDSAPSSELTWGKNWENGQIDLWKAYIPDGAMPVSVERQRHAVTGTGTSARPIRVRIRTGMSPPDDRFTLYTARGRKIGGALPSPGTGGSSVATAVPATQGVVIMKRQAE